MVEVLDKRALPKRIPPRPGRTLFALALPHPPFDQMADAMGSFERFLLGTSCEKVGGYITGSLGVPWTETQFAQFAHVVRIDQRPGVNAYLTLKHVVFDVERGAMSVANAIEACRERAAHKLASTIYCTGSDLPAVRAGIRAAGIAALVDIWYANPSLSQRAAVAVIVANRDIAAVQWAWPSTNPTTLLPGTQLTLREANADLSVTRRGWPAALTPAPAPKRTSGIANVQMSVDLGRGTVTYEPLAGHVDWGDVAETLHISSDFPVGPQGRRGRWSGRVSGRTPN